MQSANPVLPARAFAEDALLPPHQAIVAYFARVNLAAPGTEYVALDDAMGRVLARAVVADDDYPNAPRSAMDGVAILASAAPGRFEIVADDVRMGAVAASPVPAGSATRIPTGGVLPSGTDAVVPFEELRADDGVLIIERAVESGDNVIPPGADMRRNETVLPSAHRIRACDVGVLAAVGVTSVPVYRRPVLAVLSSGDELADPAAPPAPGAIRDSNRYAIAASLRAMGAQAKHFPTLRDEAAEFETALANALLQCDGVVVTGGSSVGERDRLPDAIATIAKPGAIVHGLRIKPGKPTLLGAHGGKPIVGLPGNPTSALLVLEAVAAPIVAALCGARFAAPTVAASLGAPARSRAGWTWYVPVRLRHEGGAAVAHPLPLRSFSVSLTARADGFIVMDERDEEWPKGTPVAVHRFLGA